MKKAMQYVLAFLVLAMGALMLDKGVPQVILFIVGLGGAAAAIILPAIVFAWGVVYRLTLQPVEQRIHARYGEHAAANFRFWIGVPQAKAKPATVSSHTSTA